MFCKKITIFYDNHRKLANNTINAKILNSALGKKGKRM